MSDQDGGETVGFHDRSGERSARESLGESLLGRLLDRAHLMPPRLVGPLVAQEIERAGGRDVEILVQDYDQVSLQPLEGPRLSGKRVAISDSAPGRAFASDTVVEEAQSDGSVRLHLPMLDGSDRIGVLSFGLGGVNDADRRLARRLAGLVADLVVTKDEYTDTIARVRMAQPMGLAADLLRQSLPPLAMTTPDVDIAGILEPAYEVGGDSFDYAFNEHVLHVGLFDAMGHGLEAATMATVVIATYRHGRRADTPLADLYAQMDQVVAGSFPGRFATAQLGRLDTETGDFTWVNAGHPPALWVRDGRVIGELAGPVTRPVGFGGARPELQSVRLEPGDRLLLFTDGVVEERLDGGEQFGEERLRAVIEEMTSEGLSAAESVRRLSHALMAARRGRTSDDASLLLVEWKNPPRDDELAPDVPESEPPSEGR